VGISESDDGNSEHDGRALIGWRICDLPQCFPSLSVLSTCRSFVFIFFLCKSSPVFLPYRTPALGPMTAQSQSPATVPPTRSASS